MSVAKTTSLKYFRVLVLDMLEQRHASDTKSFTHLRRPWAVGRASSFIALTGVRRRLKASSSFSESESSENTAGATCRVRLHPRLTC